MTTESPTRKNEKKETKTVTRPPATTRSQAFFSVAKTTPISRMDSLSGDHKLIYNEDKIILKKLSLHIKKLMEYAQTYTEAADESIMTGEEDEDVCNNAATLLTDLSTYLMQTLHLRDDFVINCAKIYGSIGDPGTIPFPDLDGTQAKVRKTLTEIKNLAEAGISITLDKIAPNTASHTSGGLTSVPIKNYTGIQAADANPINERYSSNIR